MSNCRIVRHKTKLARRTRFPSYQSGDKLQALSSFTSETTPHTALTTMAATMYSQHAAMAPQKPETFMLSTEAQQALPQDAQVALQQVDNRMFLRLLIPEVLVVTLLTSLRF